MAPDARADHLVVVVGASGTAPKLSSEQVSANFLGSVKSFPNGEKAIPVDQTAGSPAYVQFYVQFYGQVAGRSEAQIKAYWSRMVFTGRGGAAAGGRGRSGRQEAGGQQSQPGGLYRRVAGRRQRQGPGRDQVKGWRA